MKTINALKSAKTDKEKISLLDKTVSYISNSYRVAEFSSIIGKLVYAVNAFCALLFAMTCLGEAEDAEILADVFPVYSSIMKFIERWNTSLVSIIVFLVVFVLVIPVLCSFAAKLIMKLFACKTESDNGQKTEEENGESKDTDILREKCKATYKFVNNNRYISSKEFKKSSSVSFVIALISAAIVAVVIFESSVYIEYETYIKILIAAAWFMAAFIASQIVLSFIKPLFAYCGTSVQYTDVDYLEKLWLENDPEEVERRRVEAELEEQRRREKIAIEAKKPKVTFHAGSVSSANSITVYIDGSQMAKFDGGNDKTVVLTPGYHTIQASVYNDASESAYYLDPVSHYFEEYETYDIDYN